MKNKTVRAKTLSGFKSPLIDIDISTLPLKEVCDQLGFFDFADWQYEKADKKSSFANTISIQVGDTGNLDYNFLVSLHEIVESYLCFRRGISADEVTKFDARHQDEELPGDNPAAPYHREHASATVIEFLAATMLGIDAARYDKDLAALWEKTQKSKKRKK